MKMIHLDYRDIYRPTVAGGLWMGPTGSVRCKINWVPEVQICHTPLLWNNITKLYSKLMIGTWEMEMGSQKF